MAVRCVVCDDTRQRVLRVRGGAVLHQCEACGQVFADPQPSDDVLARIYTADYFLSADPAEAAAGIAVKRHTARLYLDRLARECGITGGRLLDVGCGNGELLAEAAARGFDVRGVDVSAHAAGRANALVGRDVATAATVDAAGLPEGHFDVCVCTDVIEHTRDPIQFLTSVHRLLKPGGVLLLTTPVLDSWPARVMRRNWFEFKTEHLHYFRRLTLDNVLQRTGFRDVRFHPAHKLLTIEYLNRHFQRFPVPGWSSLLRGVSALLPPRLRARPLNLPTGSVLAVARAAPRRERPLLSIVVPVYNERETVGTVLQTVLAKALSGIDKEIIVVEGNSTDGTREEVLRFAQAPGVQVVLQDRPRGKGLAVREGLSRARGDFVLIQDADLEYDVDDYDRLLAPLCANRQAVVLGSRHTGKVGIRSFTSQRWLSVFFNAGHVLLTMLFNLLYRQSLKDPWTMYKVFRRDCLCGLRFECNRFDFDVELMAKLARKGYTPIEVPVRYASRSFSEGKKIRVLRDPLTWIWACVKYRWVSPYARDVDTGGVAT